MSRGGYGLTAAQGEAVLRWRARIQTAWDAAAPERERYDALREQAWAAYDAGHEVPTTLAAALKVAGTAYHAALTRAGWDEPHPLTDGAR